MSAVFAPRPIAVWENVRPGDIYCESESSLFAVIIRLGTVSDLNHAGVVVSVEEDGTWTAVEAVGRGVVEHSRRPANGYVVRVTEDPALAAEIVAQARAMAGEGAIYGWVTIAWQAGRSLAALWPTRPLGLAVQAITKRISRSDRGRICSETAVEVLRRSVASRAGTLTSRVSLALAIAPLANRPSWQVTPADLFRALCGRADRNATGSNGR